MGTFQKNSLIVACCAFGWFEIRTLTSNRCKEQTNDHQQGIFKQKNNALHHCNCKLKFPNYFY